jgi:hypothetical protein
MEIDYNDCPGSCQSFEQGRELIDQPESEGTLPEEEVGGDPVWRL